MLGQLGRLVEQGKVRAVGLSNETAWGTLLWRERARAAGLPVMETVQNEYSLLCRHADLDLAEVLALEGVALLAFSPLGAGLLTGKYRGGVVPEGSRRSLNGDLSGRATARADGAVEAYHGLAREHGLDPVQMALALAPDAALRVGADRGRDHGRAAGAEPRGAGPDAAARRSWRGSTRSTGSIRCRFERSGRSATDRGRSQGLDLFKTVLVLGMVATHVIQLLAFDPPGWALWPSRATVNLMAFSGFLLAFGIGVGLSRDRPRPLLRAAAGRRRCCCSRCGPRRSATSGGSSGRSSRGSWSWTC